MNTFHVTNGNAECTVWVLYLISVRLVGCRKRLIINFNGVFLVITWEET